MISSNQELQDTLTDLKQELDYPIGSFTENVNSESANVLFINAQSKLDALYEKMRKLQDLHDFTKYYIQDAFKKNNDSFNELIKLIDTASDDYEDTTSVANSIPFNSSTLVIKDRDGSILNRANVINGVMYMASEDIDNAVCSNVNVSSNEIYYKNMPMPIDTYRSYYIVEEPKLGGIIETIDIAFKQPININHVFINCLKCSIDNIILIKNDNEYINIGTNMFFTKQLIKGIRIVVKSTDYTIQNTTVVSYSDMNTISHDKYIQNIKDGIYNAEIGVLR